MNDNIKSEHQQALDTLTSQAEGHTEVLTETMRAHLNEWLKRYPEEQKRSGVFEALRIVQEHNGGFLTVPWMNAVAEFLSLPPIAVYEVATFYSLYRLAPVGRHVIEVCTNISCMLNGAQETLSKLKERLKIGVDETTADNQFTLKEVECLGACVAAPACQIGKRYIENLTADKVDELLSSLAQEGV